MRHRADTDISPDKDRRAVVKFEIPHSAYPFEHHWLDIAGEGRVHYIDEGSGQPLLLCHGNPSWSYLYRKMIPLLSADFRCVAVDLPGFGLSVAPTEFDFTPAAHSRALEAVVDHLHLRDLIVVGQDWGGPTGLAVAGRQPDRIAGVVLGNTFAWPLTDDKRVVRFSRIMGGPAGRALAWAVNGPIEFFLRRGIHEGITKAERQWYLAPFADRSSRHPTSFFPAQLADAMDFLREVERSLETLRDRPALLLWAQKDFAFGESYCERFQTLFRHHAIELFETAGHFWQEDAPEQASQAIIGWANQHIDT